LYKNESWRRDGEISPKVCFRLNGSDVGMMMKMAGLYH